MKPLMSLILRRAATSRAVTVTGPCHRTLSQMGDSPAAAVMSPAHTHSRPEPGQADKLTDIGTRWLFSEEHDLFRANVRRFWAEEVVPYHEEWERRGDVGRELWLKAGATGLLAINTPAEQGGVGSDIVTASIMWDEQSYSNCSGPGFPVAVDVALPYLSHYGTAQQVRDYIPDIAAGRKILSIAMTEPGAGSDLQGIRTNAQRDGDDWILNGSKVFITNGYMSDVAIVVAVTDPAAKSKAHGMSLFLVDAGTPGFTKGHKLNKVGLKAQDTCELFFEDVRLPSTAILGEVNKGFYYLMNELPQERLTIAGMAIAAAEFMFEETREYVRGRKAFGNTLASLQTVQHRLAEMKTQICVGRAFQDQCLFLHLQGRLDTSTASMGKYWLSELQNQVATQCLQLHGGWGYMMEYPIARAFVDARIQPIYGGANEIMKEVIARQIVK